MILLMDTSTPVCRVMLVDGDATFSYEWQADRQLAKGLLAYLHDRLAEHAWNFKDITGLGVFKGPGSFTGLRIGLTVLNTMADAENIAIVGATGDSWQTDAITALRNGQNDRVVMPLYGSSANITTPRK